VERCPGRRSCQCICPGPAGIVGHPTKSTNKEIGWVGASIIPAESDGASVVDGSPGLKVIRSTPVW
jgi:hypothetical protein